MSVNILYDDNVIVPAQSWQNYKCENLNLWGKLLIDGVSGTNGQALITNSSGFPEWGVITSGSLTPGTSNQILTTNNSGSAAVWSSTINPNSIQLGSGQVLSTFIQNHNSCSVYYNNVLVGSIILYYTIIGDVVTLVLNSFSNVSLGSSYPSSTFAIQGLPAAIVPGYPAYCSVNVNNAGTREVGTLLIQTGAGANGVLSAGINSSFGTSAASGMDAQYSVTYKLNLI
jgi:hypothetical protein